MEADDGVTYRKVLLSLVKAGRHKNVACLWEWDGKWEELHTNYTTAEPLRTPPLYYHCLIAVTQRLIILAMEPV